jgi:hypothetical protein
MTYTQCFLFLLCTVLFMGNNLAAEPSATISPGDTIAADFLAEHFEEAASNVSKPIISELVGGWQAEQSVCLGGSASIEGQGLCDGNVALEGAESDERFSRHRSDSWIIEEASANRVSIRSDNYNFLFNPAFGYLIPNDPVSWLCELSGGEVLVCLGPENTLTYGPSIGCSEDACRLHVMMSAKRFNRNEWSLTIGPLDTSIENAVGNKFGLFNVIELSREGVLAVPAFLQTETSLDSVSLSWEYAGSSEAQFEIFRKNSLDGEYVSIALITNLQYEDQDLDAGDYWYRLFAVSGEFRSKGSNVRKVQID